jgi:FixJ family two-component response regulator
MSDAVALIALVEDDASVRQALRRLLQSAGYAVEAFASGSAFLESSTPVRSACLILDIHLADMTGFEVRARLVARGATIPTVFISAHDDAATRLHVRQSGPAVYLRKPFAKEALLSAIRLARDGGEEIEELDGSGDGG